MLLVARALQRTFSTAVSESEKRMAGILKEKIKEVQFVMVQDISNGCGSMYSVEIKAGAFTGLTKVAQHRLVTDALKKEIGEMHGLIINTKTIKTID